VNSDAPISSDGLLAEVYHFLTLQRSFGLVWLDTELIVRERCGPLVDFIELNRPVTDSIIALHGFEDDIAALRNGSDGRITVPNVVMNLHTVRPPRVSIDVYWMAQRQLHLVLVRNAIDHSNLETELSTEIRRRAIAEAEVREKSAQIERANLELALANRDLEEFAHVVSHDLKAPLRALRYDRAQAERDLATGDLEHAQSMLASIAAHEARMRAMLDGLFAYARIGHKSEAVEMVDTHALIGEIVAGVAWPPGIAIEVDGLWPRLQTLKAPLDLVLRNLIDNAIKHHDREQGRITVRAEDGGDVFKISVTDDGPGIPQDWHDAVFMPFRKVSDDPAQQDSSGVGLALVRRTLDRLGGSVELFSEAPDRRGTTFVVHWPKSISA
jgi:signal transduction histidine kinase